MPTTEPISSAQLSFNEFGTPVSTQYGDVYFSNQDGLAETEYVFLNKNKLPERWLDESFKQESNFIIGETGFGTGLNFFVTWLNFNQALKATNSNSKLIFVSFEKHPLTKVDLAMALANWPQFSSLSQVFLAQYPDTVVDDIKLAFQNDQIELRLFIGDVNHRLPEISHPKMDAWYLDGFAPSKNPDMWTQSLFDNISRLTKTNGTIATFTAAGFVRRGLVEAGFTMKKHKGFGKKREMIAGEKLEQIDQ